MATTRHQTGNSRPRIQEPVAAASVSAPRRRAPKTKTKANTSKPRSKTVASGRVEKTKGGVGLDGKKTVHRKKAPVQRVMDKVAGAVEKAVGTLEGKPGKKAAGTRKEKKTTTKRVAAPKTTVASGEVVV